MKRSPILARIDELRDELFYLRDEVEKVEEVRVTGDTIEDCIRALLKVRAAVKSAGLPDISDDLDRVIRDLDPERRFA